MYGDWLGLQPGDLFPPGFFGTKATERMTYPLTDDDARRNAAIAVISPQECISRIRALRSPERSELRLHPLAGGMDTAISWQSLRLFETEVLPALRAED